jgi:hypothetical protein
MSRSSPLGWRLRGRPAARTHRFFSPRLTPLEDRTVPSTFLVSTLADTGAGSLRAAVSEANATPAADTIRFAGGLKGMITLGSEIAVTADLTIDGPGENKITVSGNGATRLFNVSTAGIDVTIDRLTLANGKATGDTLQSPLGFPVTLGGGILNNAANLTLDRVTMMSNQAVGTGAEVAAGGAVANVFGAHLTVTRSAFMGNIASAAVASSGGAITNDGGSSALVDHSTFAGNQALVGTFGSTTADIGGGALADYGGSTMAVISCTLENNLTRDTLPAGNSHQGGAISCAFFGDLANGGSTLTVDQCAFSSNQAIGGDGAPGQDSGQGNGGAVGVSGPDSTATITRSSFVANVARAGNGGVGGGSSDLAFGGAIDNFSAALTISRSVFLDNEARGGAGGSEGGFGGEAIGGAVGSTVLVLGDEYHPPATTITDCAFAGNRAAGGAGGAAGGENPGGDGGGTRGGAIANLFGTLDLSRSELEHNAAVGGAGGAGGGFGGVARGGGLANDRGGSATVSHTEVEGNRATGGTGGTGGDGGDALGGGIFNGRVNRFTGADASLTLSDSEVRGNRAAGGAGGEGGNGGNGFGGGLFNGLSSPTATILNTEITDNRATGGAAGAGGAAGQGVGGGIYTTGTAYVHHVLVHGNKASTSDDDVFGTLILI